MGECCGKEREGGKKEKNPPRNQNQRTKPQPTTAIGLASFPVEPEVRFRKALVAFFGGIYPNLFFRQMEDWLAAVDEQLPACISLIDRVCNRGERTNVADQRKGKVTEPSGRTNSFRFHSIFFCSFIRTSMKRQRTCRSSSCMNLEPSLSSFSLDSRR